MATLHHNHAGHGFIYLKGAPERVLEMCGRQLRHGEEEPLDPDYWLQAVARLAARGQRLIAVAGKGTSPDQRVLGFADVAEGLTLLGLLGITDPPRSEAAAAVAECRSAGIRVKMITGDHGETARAIAAHMGIGQGDRVITGGDLEKATDEDLRQWVQEVDVFARSSPEHKLRLVQALQACGEVAAMTGDGVNDAPALKRADVGIAMGIKGTEVAKEAAEMVLVDDNFASIVHAVEEGRTVYDNIRKAILYILPTSSAEALVIVAAILLGRTMPITPVQILWINMVTTVTLALALAFEPAEADVMRRPPRGSREALLSPALLWRLGYVSLILVAGTFGLFLWERDSGAPVEAARTVAVNTLVMFEAFYLLNTRFLHETAVSRKGLLGNRYVLGAIGLVMLFQLGFTYAPPLQTLFRTVAIDGAAWLRIVLVGSSVFILVEMEKMLYRALQKRPRPA
jgi:magnesium-transporting ATPase (P-type)